VGCCSVAESRGSRKGVIVELDKAVAAIQKAVEAAEDVAGAAVEHAIVGIGGAHVRGVNSHGGISLGTRPREIGRDEIKQAVERARAACLRWRDWISMYSQTRLSRNVRQPDRVLANCVAGHKAERRPGAGEEWRAVTKHEGAEVESILINKTKVGQASRQVRSGDRNLPGEPSFELAQQGPDVILDQRGVGAD